MALLPILRYPDARLHQRAAAVSRVDDGIRKLIKDMAETMYAAPGIGLAATQLDVHLRVIVIDISETRDQLLVLVNPELIAASGEADREEGCLSVPGVYEKVRRAERITERGKPTDCSPYASSTRWIIWRARFSLSGCRN
jgi:peptide deformylase